MLHGSKKLLLGNYQIFKAHIPNSAGSRVATTYGLGEFPLLNLGSEFPSVSWSKDRKKLFFIFWLSQLILIVNNITSVTFFDIILWLLNDLL